MARRVPLPVIVREWGRLGVLGFGGPPAHIALLRGLVVDRRRWLDAREFEDANAACGLLPGPASTQMAIYCAHRAGGLAGALAGGAMFILPGLAAIIVLAAAALADDPPAWIVGLGAGAGAAVVPVVVAAGVTLTSGAVEGRGPRALVYLGAGALSAALAGTLVVVVLLGCGLLELAWRRARHVAAAHAWLVLAVAWEELPELAWTALKVGALSYGGGFVIIPLMQGDAVGAHGWMTDTEFLNAVAYGQLTPGPVTQTIAVVGYAAAGLPGAVLASVVAFAPSFLVVALAGERFERLRVSRTARAFLDGAGPAAVGAIFGAAVPLLGAIEEAWQLALLAAAAAILVVRRSPFVALVVGAVAGVAAALAGLPLPGR